MKKWLYNLYYSFAFQLVVFHLRSNHLLLGLWIVLILFISGGLASKLGARYLFLDPEYLDHVDFWSFLFLGFAYGGFLMSWNLTTYLLSAHQFTFLATLSRPFTKFSLNNAIIPLGMLFFYLANIIIFQYGAFSAYEIFLNCLGFLFGGFTLILFYSLYFHITNRDITYYRKRSKTPPNLIKQIAPGYRAVDLNYIKQDTNSWNVRTFLNESFQSRLVRSVAHYDSKLLANIFKQNHLNALLIQLLSMLLLIGIGYLVNNPAFRIPAGASLLILMSILIAAIGALTYWFNEWRVTVIILLLIGINYITRLGFLSHPNQAYGLNYHTEKAIYHNDSLQNCLLEKVKKDKQSTKKILENWKDKVTKESKQKPKMVFIAVSGGGLKSALWSVQVLQQMDSLLNGKLFDHTVLISGASGGMMGMSFLRELYLRQLNDPTINVYDAQYRKKISLDLLNSIAFSIISKDLFIPQKVVEIGGYDYFIDRGYVFEQQFNENTNHILDKKLTDYTLPEQRADIPLLFFTPTIINDARKMIISPQGVSYMMTSPIGAENTDIVEIDGVDFGRLLEKQNANNLRFLTAMRTSATYPYVLPNVHLPTVPEIELMDAGLLDNFGISTSLRFIHVFNQWIKENTSGVILLQISSSVKFEPIQPSNGSGIIESLFNPLGMVTTKLFTIQEYNHDNDLGLTFDLLGKENFDVVRFICRPNKKGKPDAAISFHLTEREKEFIQQAFYLDHNQKAAKKLVELLKEGPATNQSNLVGEAIRKPQNQ